MSPVFDVESNPEQKQLNPNPENQATHEIRCGLCGIAGFLFCDHETAMKQHPCECHLSGVNGTKVRCLDACTYDQSAKKRKRVSTDRRK